MILNKLQLWDDTRVYYNSRFILKNSGKLTELKTMFKQIKAILEIFAQFDNYTANVSIKQYFIININMLYFFLFARAREIGISLFQFGSYIGKFLCNTFFLVIFNRNFDY